MNLNQTIFSVLRSAAEKKGNYYDGIEIRTKSGKDHSGSLVHWNPDQAPQVACLTGDRGIRTYVQIDSIESVTIANPAKG